jgi:hypothetical protein
MDSLFLGVSILFLWVGSFAVGCVLVYITCRLINETFRNDK